MCASHSTTSTSRPNSFFCILESQGPPGGQINRKSFPWARWSRGGQRKFRKNLQISTRLLPSTVRRTLSTADTSIVPTHIESKGAENPHLAHAPSGAIAHEPRLPCSLSAFSPLNEGFHVRPHHFLDPTDFGIPPQIIHRA